jgi:hypothetical protein
LALARSENINKELGAQTDMCFEQRETLDNMAPMDYRIPPKNLGDFLVNIIPPSSMYVTGNFF